MSTVSKSPRGLNTKGTFFWFVFSAGAVACFILYRNPHIAYLILLKNMVIYGSICTVIILLIERGMYNIAKMVRRTQRKKKREERRLKMEIHQKRLKGEVTTKSRRRPVSIGN